MREPEGLMERLNRRSPSMGDMAWAERMMAQTEGTNEHSFYAKLRLRMIAASQPGRETE